MERGDLMAVVKNRDIFEYGALLRKGNGILKVESEIYNA